MPEDHQSHLPKNIDRAIVIKNEDIFFLSEKDGGIQNAHQDGFGLYYHDCRFLDHYSICINDTALNSLASISDRGSLAEFELTNEAVQMQDGRSLPPQSVGIRIQRVLDSQRCAVHDAFTIKNYSVQDIQFSLSFELSSEFDDVFEIRGFHPKRIGKANEPRWEDGVLVLSYHGADKVVRRLDVQFAPQPGSTLPGRAEFALELAAGEHREITCSMHMIEGKKAPALSQTSAYDHEKTVQAITGRAANWLSQCGGLSGDHSLLHHVLHRSLLDLLLLKSSLNDHDFFAAGLPWYGALFGRDSLICAYQSLAYQQSVAEQTLQLLAKYQGTKVDEWRDEQPGKIMHELRRGELANLNEIPQTPYYGSVDATPLFLILIGEHANWSGDLRLFRDLREHIEAALHWIDTNAHQDGNGYLSYSTKSRKGLGNQGWKDSGDSIMNEDGSLAVPPIALVEVQGYVYRAKKLIADLYSKAGDRKTSERLHAEAEDLKTRFNRDFWLDEKQFYALALQKGGRPAAVIASNPGQALWTGIVEKSRAAAVVNRLMAGDMFSGWGIRTLSVKERRANPIGYHLGTVWPHDNAFIAAGFRRYGFDAQALQIMEGILEAARHFTHYRLPEVFAGFSCEQFTVPVRYPIACHPQAWAAGSVPFLLTTLLGLRPDAFNGQLHVLRPILPQPVRELELRRIKVGKGSADLRFHRQEDGSVQVEVARQEAVEVNVEL